MIYNIYLNKIVKVFKLSVFILIGPIGSGKSEVQNILEDQNFKCYCADKIVRMLYEKKDIISNVKNILPEYIENEKINLKLIRNIIFSNIKKITEIENFIQPKVVLEFKKIIKENKNEKNLFFIFPIIKNNEFIKKYKTIYIDSKKEIRIKRLEKRKNYNKDIINKIIEYQSSIDIYKDDSHYYIHNNNSLLNLKKSIKNLIKEL